MNVASVSQLELHGELMTEMAKLKQDVFMSMRVLRMHIAAQTPLVSHKPSSSLSGSRPPSSTQTSLRSPRVVLLDN